ncbi:MAG: isomerase [Candidatus Goldiibacteriota bacterium HGW-Goldbacteria-1]|jgi:PhzF family phenazine biosynthesis protein|nr:MAG: isomerase [Candidatus Goldiibacteriota bacterium HGW-Goldbacteria-1]
MKLKLYQIDSFTDTVFKGNPAAVVPLKGEWLKTSVMQNIAAENNLSETAFYIKKGDKFHLRWFTPLTEVDLCGHATLASAYAEFFILGNKSKLITFDSRSGELTVKKDGSKLVMNFPADIISEIKPIKELNSCFSAKPVEAIKGVSDYMLVFKTEKEIREMKPDFIKMAAIKTRGIIITAPGGKCDFVSRFFAPACGINEDPVTGSAHTTLAVYWAKRLNKTSLTARQLSKRGGALWCEIEGGRVNISGNAVKFMEGEIVI